MGRPDTRHLINQDYGRRLYVPDQTYDEQMGVGSRKIAFTQNSKAYQQSNLKKPYREDAYEDMEYEADPFVGYGFDYPNYDSPVDIQPDDDTPYSPWHVKFLCFSDVCYGYGEEHCEPLSCQWPVTGFQIHSKPAGCTTNFSPSQICAQCPEGETGWISFDVIMLATFQHNGATVKVVGRYFNMSISHCIGLCDDTGIAWAAGSDATIVREATAAVAITDSLGTKGSPYSWSVSGTGFTLDNAVTTGLTNTLNADATACGTATITVTGCGSTVVTGYVRCTTGQWVVKSSCGLDGSAFSTCTTTTGNTRVTSKCKGTCSCPGTTLCDRLCSYGGGSCDAPNCTVVSGAYHWCTFYTKTEEWEC